MQDDYYGKESGYFGIARIEIEPLLLPKMPKVLEIGCGSGATLRWLKETGRCNEGHGIEVFESAAAEAMAYADSVLIGDAEQLIDTAFTGMQFDLILCLDVLEHMIDPWDFVAKLHRFLTPAGRLVTCIPNVRNVRVVLPLLIRGQWRYTRQGILDRTHLRFFTRESAIELLTTGDLRVRVTLPVKPHPRSKQGIINSMTLGMLADFFISQYLFLCERSQTHRVDLSKAL